MESWGPPMENSKQRCLPRVPPFFPQETRLPRPSAGKPFGLSTRSAGIGFHHHAACSFPSVLGALIQAGPGSAGGFGRPFGKRSG